MGIRGPANQWLKSYLSDRQFFVQVNGEHSALMNVKIGVPQGGTLSPTLYSLFTSDINLHIDCDIIQYADDTALIVHGKTADEFVKNCNDTYHQAEKYFANNCLQLNADKTEFMIYNNLLNIKPSTSLLSGKTVLEKVKYLGYFIDFKLSFLPHIQHTVKMINRCIPIIYNIRDTLPDNLKRDFYYAFVHPHIVYIIPLLASCSKAHINLIDKTLKRFLRILFKINHKHNVFNVLVQYNIKPIDNILTNSILHFMKQVYHNELPQHICQQFTKSTSTRCKHFIVPFTHFFRNNLKLNMILMWNNQ